MNRRKKTYKDDVPIWETQLGHFVPATAVKEVEVEIINVKFCIGPSFP